MPSFPQAVEVDNAGTVIEELIIGADDSSFQDCVIAAQGLLSGLGINNPCFVYKPFPTNGKLNLTSFAKLKNAITMGNFPQANVVDNAGVITSYLLKSASGGTFQAAINQAQIDKVAAGDKGPLYIFTVYYNGGSGEIDVIYFQNAQAFI